MAFDHSKEEVMNRLLSVLALAAAASLFLFAAPDTPAPAPVDLRISISPTMYGPIELLREWHPDTYTCTAMLVDEPNHVIAGSVKVVVRPGEEMSRTETSHGLTMTMKGKVDAARTGAIADVTVLRDGQVIAHQQSRVLLARSNR